MRNWICFFAFVIMSCNQNPKNISAGGKTDSVIPTTIPDNVKHSAMDICWVGLLNNKTRIFIHYQLDSNLIIGEITYLDTKDKLPIRLIGTIEDDKSYRLLEFDKTGNITGVITGNPNEKTFDGSWVSPKSKKELSMALAIKDSSIISMDFTPGREQVFGAYHYQYGDKGYNGYLEINKVGNDKIDFDIMSLTNLERGPNIAEVEKDTISMTGRSFIYKIPNSDSCEFKTTFYQGFVYINYTRGYCESQFGLGATIDGIYLKIKDDVERK